MLLCDSAKLTHWWSQCGSVLNSNKDLHRRDWHQDPSLSISTIVLLLAAAPQTPGFDCTKATTTLDRLTCSDQDLATLDRSLAEQYAQLRDRVSPHALVVLRDSQRRFLNSRKECMSGETATLCMSSRYTERGKDLAAQYKITGTLAIENHVIDRHLPRWRVFETDSFPFMTGTPPAHADTFNHYIAQRLVLAKGMFATSGVKLDTAPQGDTTFDRSYEIHRFDDRLISIEMLQSHESYFGHGWRSEYAINWDLRRDRPLHVTDFFRPDLNWRQLLYDLVMKHIRDDGDFQDPESTFSPSEIDDDEAWLFNDDGAVLLLEHGERSMVGASVEVSIPYDELQPFLRSDAVR